MIEKPLAGILYAWQEGSGSNCRILETQLAGNTDLLFQLTLPFKLDKEGNPYFYGPFIQGPPKARFLYIVLRSADGQTTAHNGRLKIPLPELTDLIMEQKEPGLILTARIPGTNPKNGGPTMATVKPVGGWALKHN